MRNRSFLNLRHTGPVLKTSTRVLQLLSLFQARRSWSGAALADELGVTTRTVRKDVDRLRELGYPVHASPGIAGGYRLGAGAELPPLLLEDQEAVAVAIGLASGAAASAGIDAIAQRALDKLEQVMPARVRKRLRAVQEAMVALPRARGEVAGETVSQIASACREHLVLSFEYQAHERAPATRRTEPHRIVHDGRRLYLVAWDLDRADWRTFRLDRIGPGLSTGARFVPRPPPEDLLTRVSRGVAQASWQFRARVKVHTSAEALARRLPWPIELEPVGPNACIAAVGSDTPELLAAYLGMLGADFDVLDAPVLRRALAQLGKRLIRASRTRSSGRRSRSP